VSARFIEAKHGLNEQWMKHLKYEVNKWGWHSWDEGRNDHVRPAGDFIYDSAFQNIGLIGATRPGMLTGHVIRTPPEL
jgi:hypothetical protein